MAYGQQYAMASFTNITRRATERISFAVNVHVIVLYLAWHAFLCSGVDMNVHILKQVNKFRDFHAIDPSPALLKDDVLSNAWDPSTSKVVFPNF